MNLSDHANRLGDWGYVSGCYYNQHGADLIRTVKIHHAWNNGADETSYAWIVEFDDGTFAAVEGSHDYTGWDCQSSIYFVAASSVEEAMRHVGDDPRRAWQSGAS